MKILITFADDYQEELDLQGYKFAEGGVLLLTQNDGLARAFAPHHWREVVEVEKEPGMVWTS